MGVNEPHVSWLPAYGPLHQQNHPAPLCRIMKMDILSQYLCQIFCFVLFILWGLYLPVSWPWKRYTEFRTQQIPCVAIKTVDRTALQRSILSSLPMKYDTKIKVLDLIKPSAEITHFTKGSTPLSTNKITRGKAPSVAPTLNGSGSVEQSRIYLVLERCMCIDVCIHVYKLL